MYKHKETSEFKHIAYELNTGIMFMTDNTHYLKKGRWMLARDPNKWIFAHRTHKSAIENLTTKLKEKYKMTGVI